MPVLSRAARLSSLIGAGYRCSQTVHPNGLSSITLQHIRLSADLNRWGCAEQPKTYAETWERGLHSEPEVAALCHSPQSQRWPSQKPWAWKEQKRWAIGTPKRQVETNPKLKGEPIVYRGPFSDTLRKVKLLSLTTCCLSVLTGPIITFLTSPQLSVILKGGVAATVMLMSASTTAALHWFAGPYVHKLTWKPGDQEMEVEVVSWMATLLSKTIQLSDLRPAKTNRPFVTFSANGKFYFVDTDRISNQELLKKLTFYQKQK